MSKKPKKKYDLPPVKRIRELPDQFKFSMEEVYRYDIPDMKKTSNLDVLKSKFVLKANEPRKKKLGKIKRKYKVKNYRKEDKFEDNRSLSTLSERLPYLKEVFIGENEPSPSLLKETNIILHKHKKKREEKQKTRVSPDDEEEIRKLKTGEDAIAFFSKAGKNTAVKFVYLNRTGSFKGETIEDIKKRDYQPYSLVVVDREKVNSEYFTMSASGVVHIQPNQPTEYMSLSDWMKESTMFNVLRRIRFFKFYLAYKCFKLWHKNARFQHFAKKRAKLAKEFFLTKKTFCSTLVDLHQNCYKLQNIEIMDFSNKNAKNGAFEIEIFVDQQQKIRNVGNEKFSNVLIESILQRLCVTVSSRARLENMNTPEAIRAYLSGKNIPKEENKQLTVKKSKSMYEAQQEDKDGKRALLKAKKEKEMLGDFIRLTDYMTIESLISLVKNTLIKLSKEMEWDRKKDKNSQRIMFNVYIDFDKDGNLIYTPPKDSLFGVFTKNSNEMIDVVSKIPRLLNLRSFKNYFLSSDLNKITWRINKAFSEDEVFMLFTKKVNNLVKESFDRTLAFGSKFESLKDEFLFVNQWDDEKYSKKNHNHESFSNELRRVDKSLKYLKWNMQTNTDCGFLRVDSKRLRKYLEPKMERILSVIKQTINHTSRKICVSLIENLKKKISDLDKQPENLRDFAVFIDTLNKVNSESEVIRRKANDKIYELAISNRDKLKTEEINLDEFEGYEGLSLEVLQEDMQNYFLEFENKKTKAELFKSKNMTKNTQELDSKINNVEQKLMRILKDLQSEQFTSYAADTEDISTELNRLDKELKEIKIETEKYNRYKKLLRDHELEWTSLTKVENLFKLRKDIWETLFNFEEKSRGWMNIDIKKIDSESINSYVQQTLHNIEKRIKVELTNKFGENYKDDVVEYLLTTVNHWKDRKSIVSDIGNKHLKEEHWQKIFKMIGTNYSVTSSYSLLGLEAFGIFQHAEIVSQVSAQATGEAKLQTSLDEIQKKWKTTEYTLKQYRENEEIYVLGSVESILDQIEEHQVILQGMQANEHIAGVKKKVDEWETRLNELNDIIEEWLTVQKKWMYLEYIFESDDIKRQLHEESSKFQAVNEIFTSIMKYTYQNKNVLIDKKTREEKKIDHLSSLQECNYILDEVQKNLEDFLQTKRDSFPRFYFLADEELLELLSQKKNVHSIQPHLNKCFDNISSLKFLKEESPQIIGIMSSDGGYIKLKESVWAHGNIEFWLQKLEGVIKETIRQEMSNAYKSFKEMTKKEWVFEDLPSQCLLTVDQIVFTSDVEKSIEEILSGDNVDALKEYKERYFHQLQDLVSIVKNKEITQMQLEMLNSLIILNVYCSEVLNKLIAANDQKERNFIWKLQIRHYWNDNSLDVTISHSNSSFNYGYEYLGNQQRLVITPLTERCFLTCTNALKYFLGGCSQGKSGTGKTETIKDLSKLFARHCVVFNCSEGLNVKIMNRMFCGLVQCGSWACFDEFNRINVEVLSVVGQYMKIIKNALQVKKRHFIFEEKDITLNSNYAVFTTLSPREFNREHNELPDNLKHLFRPCSMIIPDTEMIVEVILFSFGFESSKELSKKVARFYSQAADILSKQLHYDFGLRSIKTVLVRAGNLRREERSISETLILVRSIKDSSLPKLLKEDVEKFNKLIEEIFPKVNIEIVDNESLIHAIEIELAKANKSVERNFVNKIVELHETLQQRHGVIILGKAGTGKSVLHKTLSSAITYLSREKISEAYRKTVTHVINPKSIRIENLYGSTDKETLEWRDGIVGRIARDTLKDRSFSQHWMIFDGPIDSHWIENLNTVLDDSRMLCLTNCERIKMPSTIRFLFEVDDLSNASPATISRCGVVLLEEHHLDNVWRPFLESWLSQSEKKFGKFFSVVRLLSKSLIGPTLHHLREDCTECITSLNINLVESLCYLLDIFLVPEGVNVENETIQIFDVIQKTEVPKKIDIEKLIKQNFVFSFIWSIGGNIEEKSRKKFDSFLKMLFTDFVEFPTEGTVYDYYVDNMSQFFLKWEIPKFVYPITGTFNEIIVPTIFSHSLTFILEKIMKNNNRCVLVNGPECSGKSVILENFAQNAMNARNVESNYFYKKINLSANTHNIDLQQKIEEILPGKSKKYIGEPTGKEAIIFIDNFSAPLCDEHGFRPTLEIIRQAIEQERIYDLNKLYFRKIIKTKFISACSVKGNDKNMGLSQRVTRHFHLLHAPSISEKSTVDIFTEIVNKILKEYNNQDFMNISENLVQESIKIYKDIAKKFKPDFKKNKNLHYVFNFRDLMKLFESLSYYTPDDITSVDTFMKCWTYEICRVFKDVLSKKKHKEQLDDLLVDSLKKTFKIERKKEELDDIYFGIFDAKKRKTSVTLQSMSTKNDNLGEELNQLVDEYNFESKESEKLLFFEESISKFNGICRIFSHPGCNAVLLGRDGQGKKSLTKIAIFLKGYQIFELDSVAKRRKMLEMIKQCCFRAGILDKPSVLLVDLSHLPEDIVLEDLHHLIVSNDIPDLYQSDDKEKIIHEVGPNFRKLRRNVTNHLIFEYYLKCVKKNMHVVFCMNPYVEGFNRVVTYFPSFFSESSTIYFDKWPEDALRKICSIFLSKVTVLKNEKDLVKKLSKLAVKMHLSVVKQAKRFEKKLKRKYYVSPKSFFDLIDTYDKMVSERKNILQEQLTRYYKGIEILKGCNKDVEVMKGEITVKKENLKKQVKELGDLSQKMLKQKNEHKDAKKVVTNEEKECKLFFEKTKNIKDLCKRELDEALPSYKMAVKAVQNLKREEVYEIKSFNQPPVLVKMVLEAVCILFKRKPTFEEAVKLLTEPGFISSILNFDKENISDSILKKVKKYIDKDDFDPEKVEKHNYASKSLCMWVIAIYNFAIIHKKIVPQKVRLRESEIELSAAQRILEEKRNKLNEIEKSIVDLEVEHQNALEKIEKLKKEIKIAKERTKSAAKLVTGLSGEEKRWTENSQKTKEKIKNIIGDVLLSAGCVNDFGPLNYHYRKKLIKKWIKYCNKLKIPVSKNYSFRNNLVNEILIRDWINKGLPNDEFSIENAILTKENDKYPLIIDPQGQALKWIRNMESSNGLKIINYLDSEYLQLLEKSIRGGFPTLIQNIGSTIDPSLNYLLKKQTIKKSGRVVVRLGEKEVDYNSSFKLYFITKSSNPNFSSSVFSKVSVINFCITSKGLEDQLLSDVVGYERPDLEQERCSLIKNISSEKIRLQLLEDRILENVSKESDVYILDDIELIKALSESKERYIELKQNISKSEETANKISKSREKYREIVIRGSLLYFSMEKLRLFHPMFQSSSDFFKSLFNGCLENSKRASSLEERVSILKEYTTKVVYNKISIGLFEDTKLAFAFLICVETLLKNETIMGEEWNFFLYGKSKKDIKKSKFDWIDDYKYFSIKRLSELSGFKGIENSLKENSDDWKKYLNTKNDPILPKKFQIIFSEWRKLMIIRILRPDKLISFTKKFIGFYLGPEFIKTQKVNLLNILETNSFNSPILFLVEQGSDPLPFIEKLVKEKDRESNVVYISMGQGQGKKAEKVIKKSQMNGDWVVLQNCHLAISWLKKLEILVQQMESEEVKVHPYFRLWLTSAPIKEFPSSIVQNSVKIATQRPKGIKQNLLNILNNLDESLFGESTSANLKKIMFALFFFHSVISERMKFGKLAWKTPFRWNESDLKFSMDTIKDNFEKEFSWKTVRFLVNLQYSGKITNIKDRKIVKDLLNMYFSRKILESEFSFANKELGNIYKIPTDLSLAGLKNYVLSLPNEDRAEMFGLTEEADLFLSKKEGEDLIEKLIRTEQKKGYNKENNKTNK